MHRARSVINAINPTISKNFATWLIREPAQSRVSSQILFKKFKKLINFAFRYKQNCLNAVQHRFVSIALQLQSLSSMAAIPAILKICTTHGSLIHHQFML